MNKTYVLDTNVLLTDANAIYSFEEHDVIIPLIVLEELDAHKNRQDEVGRNARQVSRSLDELRKKGNLGTGVKIASGGTLRVASIDNPRSVKGVPSEFSDTSNVDNMIIAFMLSLKSNDKDSIEILVSKDINVRIKCDALNIKCEDYLKLRVTSDPQKLYSGVEVLELDEPTVDSFYENKGLLLTDDMLNGKKLYPNQIVVIKHVFGETTTRSAVTRFISIDKPIVPVQAIDNVFGLKPRNKEQNFSLDLLLNPDIKLVTLTGIAGSGKTLLALAAGLDQLKSLGSKPQYDRIVVTRPVQPVGREIGFLPGTLEEKMEPWVAPIRDNMSFLMQQGQKSSRKKKVEDEPYLSLLQQRGIIEIEAIQFIRGRSIPNSFILIDESQNLSMHELKTIITRVGDGTKIVLTGDIEQIDNTHVDMFTNGLTYAIEKFKDQSIAGHVTLLKGERSALATTASKIL